MRGLRSLGVLGLLSIATPAFAESGIESPSLGANQMSRGGAWLARGDDALATYFNPAAIVRHPNQAHLGAHLMFRSQCLERADASGQPVAPDDNLVAPPGEVCADIPPFPNPQLGLTYRIHPRLAIGIAVVAPHTAGSGEWPATVEYENRLGVLAPAPNPARYMLLKNDALLLFPTLALSYQPFDQLSIGAGFTWGVGSFTLANTAEAVSPVRCPDPTAPCPSATNPQGDDFTNDIYAEVKGTDAFIPGFVASALWSPIRTLDLAFWYRFSDAMRSDVDLLALAPYYASSGELNPTPATTDIEGAGRFELPIPMEAKLGLRYHHPRDDAEEPDFVSDFDGAARDAFSQDLFDIELDLSWAHNSQVDRVDIQLNERYQIAGTTGRVPLDASIPHNWRDTLGIRLGSEVVAIANRLAFRLGGFFESKGVDDQYLHVDFHLSERAGVAGGAALRLGPVDLTVAYQHTFFFPLDNGGQGQIRALSGDATVGDNRSRQPVNGGRITASLDEVALGVSYNFHGPTL